VQAINRKRKPRAVDCLVIIRKVGLTPAQAGKNRQAIVDPHRKRA
jgi:hypothetical protein